MSGATSALAVSQLAATTFASGPPGHGATEEDAPISPLPSTVAGFARTLIGDALGWDWSDPAVVAAARALAVRGFAFTRTSGPAAMRGDLAAEPEEVLVASPLDSGRAADGAPLTGSVRLTPTRLRAGEGADLPVSAPLPLLAPPHPPSGTAVGPAAALATQWWRWADVDRWLQGEHFTPAPVDPPGLEVRARRGRRAAGGPTQAAAAVGYRGWDIARSGRDQERWRLLIALAAPVAGLTGPLVGHLGGERRPVVAEPVASGLPEPSAELRIAAASSTRLTLRLLTPAAFDGGWLPGWLDRDERPSDAADLPSPWEGLLAAGARLVSAAVGAPLRASGWSLDRSSRGPKVSRRLAPAGSAYFLDLERPLTPAELDALWMTPVSDLAQDRRDGFGTAVWGVWHDAA